MNIKAIFTAAFAGLAGMGVALLPPATAHAGLCASTSSCLLTLDQGNAGSGFGSGNFGTVDLELNTVTDVVTVTVDLASGFNIINTGFPGSFGFHDSLGGGLTIGGFSSAAYSGSLSDATDDLHFDGFGFFNDAAATTGPAAGDPARQNSVSFTVSKGTSLTDVNQLLNLANPAGGDGASYFVVDAINNNTTGPGAGLTGLISVTGTTQPCTPGPTCCPPGAPNCGGNTPTPEPTSLAILGAALFGIGVVRRRYKV